MVKLFNIICLLAILKNAVGQTQPETFYKYSDDWRIIAANSATGQKWYFNPDLIWMKDSLFSCKIRMTIDPQKKKAYDQMLMSKGYASDSLKKNLDKYGFSIYYLIINCSNKSISIYGLLNLTDQGEQLDFIKSPSNILIPLTQQLKETIRTNICNYVISPLFDRTAVSPF